VPRVPPAVRWIVRTLEEAGFETWTVGGAVRDALLGGAPGDWDLTTAARPQQVRRLFRRTIPVGIEHGTVGVLARDGTLFEVTTFRRDVETHGRHAVVEFADTLDEDLARRDFTINAVAWHPVRHELRDPFEGAGDLRAGILRTVGVPEERFAEDYLRVLRALRFAGRFGMEVEGATWKALCAARGSLGQLSPERVRDELLKVLGGSREASRALSLLAASGVLAELFPELDALVGLRPAGDPVDLWTRTLLLVDALPPDAVSLRLGALLHALGVPGLLPEGGGREALRRRGVLRTMGLLERLRFSNLRIQEVAALVEAVAFPPDPEAGEAGLRRWLARVGRGPVRGVCRIQAAGARVERALTGGDPAPVAARIRSLRKELGSGAPLAVEELALGGSELKGMGLRPGPHFGQILRHLLERVLEAPELNRREVLEALTREWLAAQAPPTTRAGEGRE